MTFNILNTGGTKPTVFFEIGEFDAWIKFTEGLPQSSKILIISLDNYIHGLNFDKVHDIVRHKESPIDDLMRLYCNMQVFVFKRLPLSCTHAFYYVFELSLQNRLSVIHYLFYFQSCRMVSLTLFDLVFLFQVWRRLLLLFWWLYFVEKIKRLSRFLYYSPCCLSLCFDWLGFFTFLRLWLRPKIKSSEIHICFGCFLCGLINDT